MSKIPISGDLLLHIWSKCIRWIYRKLSQLKALNNFQQLHILIFSFDLVLLNILGDDLWRSYYLNKIGPWSPMVSQRFEYCSQSIFESVLCEWQNSFVTSSTQFEVWTLFLTHMAWSGTPLETEVNELDQTTLQWRHNGHDGVSNHQPHHCLLDRLFRRKSKKTSKFRVTGLWEGNSPVTGEFLAQRASNAENVSIWWRHHAILGLVFYPWLSKGLSDGE